MRRSILGGAGPFALLASLLVIASCGSTDPTPTTARGAREPASEGPSEGETLATAEPPPMAWHVEALANDCVGGVAMALDRSGAPVVLFRSPGPLRLARRTGERWETVDVERCDGLRFSLAVGSSGGLHVLAGAGHYGSSSGQSLAFSRLGEWRWTTSASRQSLALDERDRPHVCLAVQGGGEGVRHAVLEGETWRYDEVSREGRSCAIALGREGEPHLAFVSDGAVIYARRDGASWVTERVAERGLGPRIALDARGRPHVAYVAERGPDGGRLELARRQGAADLEEPWARGASAGWARRPVETLLPPTAERLDMAFDGDGDLHMVYVSTEGERVGYLRWGGERWRSELLDAFGDTDGVDLALDARGEPHIAFTSGRFAMYARPAASGCPPGRQHLAGGGGDACCWPGQTWSDEAAGCQGDPDCPRGFVRTDEGCDALDPRALYELETCIAQGFLSAQPCSLSLEHDASPAYLEPLCREEEEAGACEVLGALHGEYLVGFQGLLYLSVCPEGSQSCRGRRSLSFALRGPLPDAGRSRAAYERACRLGRAHACLAVAADDEEHRPELYTEACQLGLGSACHGAVDWESPGAPGNALAAERFEQGCDAGDVTACHNLAFMHVYGLGVTEDPSRAGTLYRETCGPRRAREEEPEEEGYPDERDERARLSACIGLVALAQGHPRLARRLRIGTTAAAARLEAACEAGALDGEACRALALMCREGLGARRDPRRARELEAAACEQGPGCSEEPE